MSARRPNTPTEQNYFEDDPGYEEDNNEYTYETKHKQHNTDMICAEDPDGLNYVIVNNAINTANHFIMQVEDSFRLARSPILYHRVKPMIDNVRMWLARIQLANDDYDNEEKI